MGLGLAMAIHSKFFVISSFCLSMVIATGCEKLDQTRELDHTRETVSNVHLLETVAAPIAPKRVHKDLRPPMNCPMMIVAMSTVSDKDGETHLRLGLKDNPDFDLNQKNACEGDIKNLWPDLGRFEDEIESHLPNVRGWFNAHIIMDNFPKTQQELKSFIDDASKVQGLPNKLEVIDRSTLEGGLEYNGKILDLIIQQDRLYWQAVHSPVVNAELSKISKVKFSSGAEKHAFCYHPHHTCRGYPRYHKRNTDLPESRIGVESDYNLEYLWAGIGSVFLDFEAVDTAPN